MTGIASPRTLAYLATPYTRFPGGTEAAFLEASKLAARLLRAGIKVFSPIVHTHPIATFGALDPLDHAMWMALDVVMLSAADVLIVAHMPSWEESKGIAIEIEYFEKAGKPIFDLEVDELRMTKRRPSMIVPDPKPLLKQI